MLGSEGDKDPLENEEGSKNIIKSKENFEIGQDHVQEDVWKEKIKAFFKENGISNNQELETCLNGNLEDLEKFYSLNHLIAYHFDNPTQRTEINNSEKNIESFEEVLKEWYLKLKELQKIKVPFMNAFEALHLGIEGHLPLFKINKEFYFILNIFVELFKTIEKDIESFLTSLKESFE